MHKTRARHMKGAQGQWKYKDKETVTDTDAETIKGANAQTKGPRHMHDQRHDKRHRQNQKTRSQPQTKDPIPGTAKKARAQTQSLTLK